ncbi:hypothetical protein [Actinocrinis sp.]|jgi:hypothetical protein|uniref:hypothetical protein n=1 Tax=Actinocrinis sp. TaxID=1920516 RepID=UPI002D080501|nr:hypothetical protein [Actinocrinis sp.]HXR74151.1 hypothetical protein [Actinocrinis sp.]
MRLLVRILIPLAGVALLAGCGSSGNSSSASSSASTGASAAGGQSADTAAVTQVWQSFFSKDTPISQKETLLQNGTTTMKPALQAFAADPRVGQASATVQKVTFPDANDADVTYQIALNGTVMMGGMAGKAIKQNGQWLVADSTLCGLLQLAAAQGGGSSGAIPGCS